MFALIFTYALIILTVLIVAVPVYMALIFGVPAAMCANCPENRLKAFKAGFRLDISSIQTYTDYLKWTLISGALPTVLLFVMGIIYHVIRSSTIL